MLLFTDACQRLKEVLSVIEFFDDEELDEADELREILNHYHIRSLMQVKRIPIQNTGSSLTLAKMLRAEKRKQQAKMHKKKLSTIIK